jgi:hypothetical protein
MSSLARRHRERALAAATVSANVIIATGEAPPAPPQDGPAAVEYRRLLEHLGEDLRTLSNVQSVERKIETKRELIARYRAWCEGALSAPREARAAQDEIVVTMLVWSIDIGDWTFALQLAMHVLTHGLSLPERYKRTPATLVAEEIADRALAEPDAVDYGTLTAADFVTAQHDMPDEVRAKLMKALGRRLMLDAESYDPDTSTVAGGKAALLAAALDSLRRALKLDDKVGVKKDIEQVERDLRRLAAANDAGT